MAGGAEPEAEPEPAAADMYDDLSATALRNILRNRDRRDEYRRWREENPDRDEDQTEWEMYIQPQAGTPPC